MHTTPCKRTRVYLCEKKEPGNSTLILSTMSGINNTRPRFHIPAVKPIQLVEQNIRTRFTEYLNRTSCS